jgi:hypothetical protein
MRTVSTGSRAHSRGEPAGLAALLDEDEDEDDDE